MLYFGIFKNKQREEGVSQKKIHTGYLDPKANPRGFLKTICRFKALTSTFVQYKRRIGTIKLPSKRNSFIAMQLLSSYFVWSVPTRVFTRELHPCELPL